ncbi:hypothetical protein LCGC14_0918560 [marine sediment metagenome]|uniref:Uncharacterized protein n=1 Tax=marine sediment metagenome TaxID=412755 RepID=A0A0F9RY32_9ZZZZ
MDNIENVFQNTIRTCLNVFQTTIQTVSQVITTGDGALKELDTALRGGGGAPSESSEQAFSGVLSQVQELLADARDKGNVADDSVTQKARNVLSSINRVEPAWRPGPMSMSTTTDFFRMTMRDLRGSTALISLATGRGNIDDVMYLGKWAEDINDRIKPPEKEKTKPVRVKKTEPKALASVELAPVEAPKRLAPVTKPKAKKKKAKQDPVKFARAVAEEMNDDQVKTWAQEFADGQITEQKFVEKLTKYAAQQEGRFNMDDIYDRAAKRG